MLRRGIQLVVILTLTLVITAGAGKVIDAVLVTVNGVPLLQSDLEEAARFEALMQQKAPGSPVEMKPVLDRLIDQELLRQQMGDTSRPTAEQVATQMKELRSHFKGTETEAGWNALLKRYGLTDEMVRERISTQLQILEFVDVRIRPTVKVDEDAIRTYYSEKLVPQLRQMNANVEPLENVAPKIREVLVQQKMDSTLSTWLANLRSQSKIHVTQRSRTEVSVQKNSEAAVSPSKE